MKHALPALRVSWPGFALAALILAGYRGLGATGFASEDFLILRHLHPLGFWGILSSELQGPWLGLSFVNFYRPVSTALLALELKAWGLDAAAFHWSHLAVHGLNTFLVGAVARRLTGGSRAVPLALSALFAVSPLHPSAVAFVGSFATVFGGCFVLVTLACFLRFRETGERGAYGLAVAGFVLALGAYEAAAVLPAALLADVLVRDPRRESPGRRILAVLPFLALAGAYFLLRRIVLGVFVGGYSSFQDRFLEELAQLAGKALTSLPQLVLPRLHAPFPGAVALGLGGALVAVTLLFFARRPPSPLASAALLGLIWAVIFQAPFFFTSVVPATGRFWYLPCFAATLSALAVTRGLAESLGRFRRPGRVLWLVAVAAVLVHHFTGLRADLAITFEADREVRAIQAALAQREAQRRDEPWLVAGVPDFARGEAGLPVAKIFQYGLHEASRPPFRDSAGWVYPVPADVHPLLVRELALAADARILRWDRSRLQLVEASEPAGGPPPEPSIRLSTADGFRGLLDFRCEGCRRVRLFLLTSGPPYRSPWQEVVGGGGSIELPRPFLESMALHHDGQVLGWLEGPAGGGPPTARSEVFVVPLSRFEAELRRP